MQQVALIKATCLMWCTPHSQMWPGIPKEVNMHTVSRHTFHHHLITTSINQQYMYVIQLEVKQSAFTQASFHSLSDVHECSGGLQMAPSLLDKQSAGCNSSHNWLMSLAMDIKHYSCFVWYAKVKKAPMDVIWLFSVDI